MELLGCPKRIGGVCVGRIGKLDVHGQRDPGRVWHVQEVWHILVHHIEFVELLHADELERGTGNGGQVVVKVGDGVWMDIADLRQERSGVVDPTELNGEIRRVNLLIGGRGC